MPKPFIAAVSADVVAVDGGAGDSVGGQARAHGVDAVGGARGHLRNHRGARPHFGSDFLQRSKHVAAQRRRRKALAVGSAVGNVAEVVYVAHRNVRIGKYFDQLLPDFFGGVSRAECGNSRWLRRAAARRCWHGRR